MMRKQPFVLALVLAFFASWDAAHAQTGCPAAPIFGDCTDCIPLTDLGDGFYKGFQGGLYPGGANAIPEPHRQAALAAADEVVARASDGTPDPNGVIGMAVISMSNGSQEFAAFERRQDLNPGRNAQVVLVDTAQGGWSADAITGPTGFRYWDLVQERLEAAGMACRDVPGADPDFRCPQVQVVWVKEADASPCSDPDFCPGGGIQFPGHARQLRSELRTISGQMRRAFPNLKLAYFSSRIFGGYSSSQTRGEPLSFETGFSVKWLIESQVNCTDSALCQGTEPRQPILLWGPYLWAKGDQPRSDGAVWCIDDLEGDKVHPALGAETKVSSALSRFFDTHETSQPWFPAQEGTDLIVLDAIDDATVDSAPRPDGTCASPNLGLEPSLQVSERFDSYLRFDTRGIIGDILHAKLSLRTPGSGSGGGRVHMVADSDWTEESIDCLNAPPIDPGVLAFLSTISRDNAFHADVTSAFEARVGGLFSLALTFRDLAQTGAKSMRSRQSEAPREPPRLVLSVRTSNN